MKKLEMKYVCQQLNVKEAILIEWLEADLVVPAAPEGPAFDDEDLSRIKLLNDLQSIFDTNTSSLEVIMHLLDQIHLLKKEINLLQEKQSEL